MIFTTLLPTIISTNEGHFSIVIEEDLRGNFSIVLRWGKTMDAINNGVRIDVAKGYDPEDVYRQIKQKIISGDKKFLAEFKNAARVDVKRGNLPRVASSTYYQKRSNAYLSA